MINKSRVLFVIIFIALLQAVSEDFLSLKFQENPISIVVSRIYTDLDLPADHPSSQELSIPNWIVRRSGVSGQLASYKLIVSDERHIYQFQLSSLSQDYGCIFTGPVLNVRIVNSSGDEVDNVPIRWTSPVGTGLFSTKTGRSLDLPLY